MFAKLTELYVYRRCLQLCFRARKPCPRDWSVETHARHEMHIYRLPPTNVLSQKASSPLHSHPMRQLERQKSTRRCLQALSRLRSLTCDRPIVGRDFQELGYLYNVRHAISVSGRCLHLEAFQTIILYASTNAPFLFKVHIIL